jgi:hypothetical protein
MKQEVGIGFLSKTLYGIRYVITKLLPAVVFAALACFIAISIDRYNIDRADGEDFVNYTSFTVNNSREGEDVFFSVCRDHDKNYNYTGSLSVYVLENGEKTPVQVYARDIKGSIHAECDNKVLYARDYFHKANIYEMTFCVDFVVKYEIKKTVCKKSNRYRVYPQPTDLESKISSLQNELNILQQQRAAAQTNSDMSTSPTSFNVPEDSPTVATQPTQATPIVNSPPTPTHEECTVNLANIRLNCRQVPN